LEIEVVIELNVPGTNPDRGRAKITVAVPYKDDGYAYKVSSTSVCLFDPQDETNLNENTEEVMEDMPQDKDTVTLDVELGPGLKEKVEKCKSKTLQLQLKILLHMEPTYTAQNYRNIERV
jgi:hypothetical protein